MKHSKKFEQLRQISRKKGLRLTVQKRKVLETIASRKDHPTVDQIFVEVQEEIPDISRATVYRVLDSFVNEGVICRISHPEAACRYDPNTEHHHHLLCMDCSQVLDLELPSEEKFTLPSVPKKGYEIFDYSIYFRGLCPQCQEKKKEKS